MKMASYLHLLSALLLILTTGLQGSPTVSTLTENYYNGEPQMVDMVFLLKRLDQLEAKVENHEHKINSQQIEIDQLKKRNVELEERNLQLLTLVGDGPGKTSDDDVTSRNAYPRSCFEVKAMNPTAQTGMHYIDPDGRIDGDPPISVYCDMTTMTTYIPHDTESKTNVTSCADPGCYTKSITYNATMRQMLMLADISSSCSQKIRFDSFVVPLEYNNEQYGFWNDRNGMKQIFWAGPATSQHTCQCGIINSCVERTYKCNADSLAPIDLVDEGFIDATELLPVTKLNFGRTSLTGVRASYTLGRFQCSGQAPITAKPTSCQDLFKMGHTLNGFYDVQSGSNKIASVYCDFGRTPTNYQTSVGIIDIKTSSVHFYVARTKPWSTNGAMLFEKEYLNVGGGMNINNGVFTVPKAGIYSFSFRGVGAGNDGTRTGYGGMHFQLNNSTVAVGFTYVRDATSGYLSLSLHTTLKLNAGDKITMVFNYGGSIYADSNNEIQFMGSLLEEDLLIS